MTKPHVLVLDDEKRALETIHRVLKPEYKVHLAQEAKSAWDVLYEYPISVVLSDQRMPDTTGIEFLKQVKKKYPEVVRIIISGYTDADDLILGINEAGIYQFLCKPWHPDNLKLIVSNAVKIFDLQQQNQLLSLELNAALPTPSEEQLTRKIKRKKKVLKKVHDFSEIVRHKDSVLNSLCEQVKRFAAYDISVLISGESGTGKELFARAIHHYSHRADKPLMIENCAALPDDLLESELFGCRKGAFTGAYEDRAGLFEKASGGTVFLDEIGDISPAFQVKLLRVLQEKVIRRLGDHRYIPVDIRIIAATNKDLEAEVKAGNFRQDLYFRLSGASFELPPLRERKNDIPVIAKRILKEANTLFGTNVKTIGDSAMALLLGYEWAGNIRELQNELHYAAISAQGSKISMDDLSSKLQGG